MHSRRLHHEQMQEGIGKRTIAFLNTPSAIITLLDKQICKQKLVQAKIPVTETVGGEALLTMQPSPKIWFNKGITSLGSEKCRRRFVFINSVPFCNSAQV